MLAARLTCLVLCSLLAVPAASAWTLAPASASTVEVPASHWAWTFGLARPAPGGLPGAALGAAACALGDVNADGVGDLVVQVAEAGASGRLRLSALAGPDFKATLWSQAASATRVLECAPPLGLDGVATPVLRTVGKASSAGAQAAGVADEAAQQVFQAIDGATGMPLLGRVHRAAHQGVSGATAGGAFGVAQTAAAALLPAAGGAEAFLQATVKEAHLLAALQGGLPSGTVTSQLDAAARLDLLDSAGRVVGSVALGAAGELPLAVAPVPIAGGLPDVVALTRQTVSPIAEAAAGVPKVALHTADGALAWSTELEATTGVPLLVPRAGDLDLDGVPDLLVETVQMGTGALPAGGFTLLSGLDGSVLLSPPPVDGLLAALPLGALPTGPALLQAEHASAAAALTLSAIDGAGKALWSVEVDAAAQPINAVLDAYTGDLLGFSDLTGDRVPDVGVAVEAAGSLALKAIDGATGKVAWTAELAVASDLVPVALATVKGQLAHAAAGAPAALLAVGAREPVLTLLDAATGQAVWTSRALLVPLDAKVELSAEVAGDLDADGVQDLLVTVASLAAGAQEAATSLAALSGATGQTLWSASTDPTRLAAPFNFTAEAGPAFANLAVLGNPDTERQAPMPTMALAAAVLLAVALVRRRA